MPVARVKWFSNAKGYGFLSTAEGDVFVHHQAIQADGYRSLRSGDEVQFELIEGDRGPSAHLVRPIVRRSVEIEGVVNEQLVQRVD